MSSRVIKNVLYTLSGVLITTGGALVLYEVRGAWLVFTMYEREVWPLLDFLVSDRSVPLIRYQLEADRLVNSTARPAFRLTLLGILLTGGYYHRKFLQRQTRPLFSFAKSLPMLYQWTILLIVSLLFIGQVADTNRVTFPFTSWKMYGSEFLPNQVVYYELKGQTVDGTTVRLNPSRLFRSIRRPVYWGLEARGEAIWRESEHKNELVYDQILQSIGWQYERTHDIQLEKVQALRHTVAPIQADTSWQEVEVFRQVQIRPRDENRLAE